MEKPKLVASDVDGTLLDPRSRLTGRTARAIARVIAAEVPFVLVSGRPPRWITPVAELAGLAGYAVCANGAVVIDIATRRPVRVDGLDPVLLSDVAHALERALPGSRLAVERADAATPYLTEPGYSNPWGDSETYVVPRAEVLGHPATKLLVRHGEMTSEEMAEAAEAVLRDHAVDITFSTSSGLIELSADGVSKASGLGEVCRRLGIAAADVVAFGDMPNDVRMLRWAGHGVAMANAHREALAAADEVTAPNSEDGVAQILERWF